MKREKRVPEIMTTGEVARFINRSPDMVRAYARTAKLDAERTLSGQRFFRRTDVERFAAASRREMKSGRRWSPSRVTADRANRRHE